MSLQSFPSGRLVLRPGDAGYGTETAGFQTGFAQRPALVCPASSPDDIAAAVAYAAGRSMPVDVQATGHGMPGTAEGRLLITTRRMDSVTVDPVARTARIAAGARSGQVVAAAAAHGLAPLNGSSPGVGAVSYTLGCGLGILGRTFGHAADHVRSLDVVTADGRLRHVTPASDEDLFWALLGGGADFGVVTELETALVPVARLYGGSLTFDGGSAFGGGEPGDGTIDPREVLRGYTEWTRTVPDELTSSFAAVPYPDLPVLPERLRGRYVLSVRIAYTGPADEGERLVAPLRALGPVLGDSLRQMPYAESRTIHSDPDSPHSYYGDSAVLRALDAGAADELLRLTGPDAPMPCVLQVNHVGGALGAPPPVPNAVPHRDGRFLVRLLSVLDGTGRDGARTHYEQAFGALAPWTIGRALNFSFGGGDRAERLYEPETAGRLATLKRRYDPAGLFRRGYGLAVAGG